TGPPTLTFQELITAAEVDPPPPELQRKMSALFNTPFVSNSAAVDSSTPSSADPGVLHIAEWNIYRTMEDEGAKLALADAPAFLEKASNNPLLSDKKLNALREQLGVLQQVDIVILNEIDNGVDREHYHNVPDELAAALHMNRVFAVEFLELNRIYLGMKKMDVVDASHAGRENNFGLDPDRYLGLEGTALLSRYPIRSARVIHLPDAYDWYHDEIHALSDLEKVRRWTAERVFHERIRRQVRRGGRLALVVELNVPGAPGGTVTVVCPHLEDYCGPKGRRRQMDYLLTQIRGLKGPVIIGGDLNTLGHNARPLTVGRFFHNYVLNYRLWAREAFYFFLPTPGTGEVLRGVNYAKNLHDPTAASVPIILSNPERQLFEDTRSFHFEDGGTLDFSGDPKLTYKHHARTLAMSAQRQWKGFTPSFSFGKTLGGFTGGYKLDWIFVKHNKDQPAQSLTPEFGRTLTLVNKALVPRISPHSPTELEIRFDSESSVRGAEMRHP
ncbi:MAG TPA: endonuclease/exonuclease/phosphatase family protein, partial [Bryobacteraceae bacterium]|nr:endonuclease/exonuclease/phosphatase family protein [Bryobacteraceae bacterium]